MRAAKRARRRAYVALDARFGGHEQLMQRQTTIAPAQGATAIDILVNDHRTIKNLLARLADSRSREERMQCLKELQGVLTVHNATEENLVYPALNRIGKKMFESLHLYYETANAAIHAFEIDTMLKEGADDDKIQAKVEKFRDAILEHIDDEENKAFPHLQEAADGTERQQLNQSVQTFRGSISFEPMDGPPDELTNR